jgi:hypothetical protein
MYEGIFLTQDNRPEAMGYFDFVIGEIHGLRVKELMDHRPAGQGHRLFASRPRGLSWLRRTRLCCAVLRRRQERPRLPVP